jgi:hypothetical protein
MVRYTGRARTRTGSVNTNQLGLKMSGCPSTVGKKGRIARYMARRVDCMMGFCRPVRYHDVIWPRTRMRNQPPFCKRGATRCQAAAGGVGTNHNIPYYRTPKKGESGCTPAPPYSTQCIDDPALISAIAILTAYASEQGQTLCMIGDHETVHDDLPLVPGDFTKLTVDTSPPLGSQQLEAVAYLNGLRWVGPVNGVPQLHVAAMVTSDIRGDLLVGGFGQYIDCGATLIAFADEPCIVVNMKKTSCPRNIDWWSDTWSRYYQYYQDGGSWISNPALMTLEYDGNKARTDKGRGTYDLYFKATFPGGGPVEANANKYSKYAFNDDPARYRFTWTVHSADQGYECAACSPVTPGFGDPPSKSRCNPNCYKITDCEGYQGPVDGFNCY